MIEVSKNLRRDLMPKKRSAQAWNVLQFKREEWWVGYIRSTCSKSDCYSTLFN